VGGVVGLLNGSAVSRSFFNGEVLSSSQNSTGLIAGNCAVNCSVSASYYIGSPISSQLAAIGGYRKSWTDMPTATDLHSISNISAYKLDAEEFKKQTNFTSATSANGQTNPGWDLNKTWFIYEGQTAPMLRAFMTPLTITANSVVKTYDGSNYQATTAVSYSQTPDSRLLGSTSFSGSAIGAKNVGTYGIQASGQYSEQLGYLIHYVDGSLNINPANLTVSGISANNKTYDRSTSASINTSLATLNGVINGDSVSLSASNVYGAFADSSVANAKTVSIYGLGISGVDASNYNLVQPVSVANITAEVKASSLQETYLSVSQDIPQTWNSENVISTASVSPLQRSKRPMTMPDGVGSFRAPALVQLVGEGIKTAMD
jgi:hypothetical protein